MAASGELDAGADEAGLGEEEAGAEKQERFDCGGRAADDDLPEMLALIDAVEEAGADPPTLISVLKKIGRRIRTSPGDRDLLSDFEGISQICNALASPTHQWQGEAMLTFCRLMPDMCRTSTVNRGSLRDAGFVTAVVELLRSAVMAGDEASAIAACVAISALCTANDGNKQAVAQLWSDVSGEDVVQATPAPACRADKPGGMMLLLEVLGRFPASAAVQTEGLSALRALLTDDDKRKASCGPSAVENREAATSDAAFPFFGAAVERGLALADASERPLPRLREQALLLLREIARQPDHIRALALGANLLPCVQASVKAEDARVVRASLAVLRGFVVVEEVRDEVALSVDGAIPCIKAVWKHILVPAVCEQGFGLFANLTMRKSPIAAKLNAQERGVIALGFMVLRQHRDRPDAMRSVLHTLRNVAIQDEASSKEVQECGIFEEARQLVKEHDGDTHWCGAVDIARQFLREFHADAGIEKAAKYNAYY